MKYKKRQKPEQIIRMQSLKNCQASGQGQPLLVSRMNSLIYDAMRKSPIATILLQTYNASLDTSSRSEF